MWDCIDILELMSNQHSANSPGDNDIRMMNGTRFENGGMNPSAEVHQISSSVVSAEPRTAAKREEIETTVEEQLLKI
jgi:hypothetical protein